MLRDGVTKFEAAARLRKDESQEEAAAGCLPEETMCTPAVLLDRDGTLIEDRHYLADPQGVTLLPGVGEGLALLQQEGWKLFVVSNQSGVGRGFFSESAVQACQARLDALLLPFGVCFTDSVWCPHAPEDACACRKPQTGLWKTLEKKHGLCAAESVMIGDKLSDMAFAANAGLALGILTLTGKGGREAATAGWPVPKTGDGPALLPNGKNLTACDVLSAARWLCRNGRMIAGGCPA